MVCNLAYNCFIKFGYFKRRRKLIGRICFGIVITVWLSWLYFAVYKPAHEIVKPAREAVETFEEWTDSLTSLEVIK